MPCRLTRIVTSRSIEVSPVAPVHAHELRLRNRWGALPGFGCAIQGDDMAKALFGHVGSAPDRRMLDEVTQLRAKVRALEFEVTRLRAENDRLAAAAAESDQLIRLPEPALA